VRQLENICHWLTVMAPTQVIEVKDLPPEVLDLEPSSRAATVLGIPTESPSFSGAAPLSVAVDASDTHAKAAPVLGAAGVVWESGLEQEALAMLNQGRHDVWDELTRRFETSLIQAALATTRGRRIEAAQKLGIGRNTITRKIQELGLDDA
jgi:two-component system nitrogen regulation response regulator GlnG